jgi:hypothetical protein
VHFSNTSGCCSTEKIEKKLEKFNTALRIINEVFHSAKVRKHTRLGTCKTLVRPILTYGSEAWNIRKQYEQRLTTAETKFMRRTAGYSLVIPYEKQTLLRLSLPHGASQR